LSYLFFKYSLLFIKQKLFRFTVIFSSVRVRLTTSTLFIKLIFQLHFDSMGAGKDWFNGGGLKFVRTVFVNFIPLANKTVFEKHRPINYVCFSQHYWMSETLLNVSFYEKLNRILEVQNQTKKSLSIKNRNKTFWNKSCAFYENNRNSEITINNINIIVVPFTYVFAEFLCLIPPT